MRDDDMSQTTILAGGQAAGFPGLLADDQDADIVSGWNQDATQLPFGYGLRIGSSGLGRDFYSLPTGPSGPAGAQYLEPQGAAIFSYDHAPQGTADSGSPAMYQGDVGSSGLIQNAAFEVLRRGRFYAPVEAAVKVGDRA